MITIAVDAMGGDHAPQCNVEGAVAALNAHQEIKVALVGIPEEINKVLSTLEGTYDQSRLEIVPASEVIATDAPPVESIRKKKDSSLVVGMNLVKEKKADALVSCGSSGAILVGGQLIAGRIPGVKRAAFAPVVPTSKGQVLLIDCGANVDAKSENLVQFAVMGSLYMKSVFNIEKPRVGLVNIGAEAEKGNALTKETYPLLEQCSQINFIGNVEARDIPSADADVLVTEAFVGNVVLKLYEGMGKTLLTEIKNSLLSSTRGKLAALMAKPSLKKVVNKFGGKDNGGAPVLGLTGLIVKAHGSSTANEVKNAIIQCIAFSEQNISGQIEEAFKKPASEEQTENTVKPENTEA